MAQEQLAEKADMGQKQISKMESGRVHAKLSTYLHIANVFGVSIDYLLADTLLVDPQEQIGAVLRGESERRLTHDVIRAMVRYRVLCYAIINEKAEDQVILRSNAISIIGIFGLCAGNIKISIKTLALCLCLLPEFRAFGSYLPMRVYHCAFVHDTPVTPLLIYLLQGWHRLTFYLTKTAWAVYFLILY